MRGEGVVVLCYLLAALLSLTLAAAREPHPSPRSIALAVVAALHFCMVFVNVFFFSVVERTDSDYFYDRDFGRYWRWG